MRMIIKKKKNLSKMIVTLLLTICVSGCSWNKANVEVNKAVGSDESSQDMFVNRTEDFGNAEISDIALHGGVQEAAPDVTVDSCSFETTTYGLLRSMVSDTTEFYGGSYIDEKGKSVVLLTEDSEENRDAICLALGISEGNTIFQMVTYTLSYMTQLSETIEQANLPFVTSVAFYETLNKIEVVVVTDNKDDLQALYELDTIGGAIEVKLDKANMWNLLLVNPWNSLPKDFDVELVSIGNGHYIDERAYDDLQTMLKDAKKAGMSMFVCSSYRTNAKQTTLYNNKIKYYQNQGYSKKRAQEKAGTWVARPGTSEHQLGLALDIVSTSYTNLDKKQERTKEQKWLMANSYKYGFILRYPSDKCDVTGINYEPWHYRYVGKTAAKEIYEKGICLEEYLLY